MIAALIAATAALPAMAETVTFDDVTSSPVFVGVTPDVGEGPTIVRPNVVFTGGVILNAQEYNSAANNVYATDDVQTLADGSNLPGVITGIFTQAVNAVSFDIFNGYIGGVFTVSAYGAGDTLLGTSSVALPDYPAGGPSPVGQLSFADAGILKFMVTSDQGAGNVSFAIDTVTFPDSSAAPEPATWAMMVGGFGLAGAALRRRPKVRVALRA